MRRQASGHGTQDSFRLFAGAGVVLGGRLAGRGLHLLGNIVLARLLGPTDFGLYALGWTVLRLAETVAPLGLPNGVIRFGSPCARTDPPRCNVVISRALATAFLSSLAVGLALAASAPWIAAELFQVPGFAPVLRLFAAAVPAAVLLQVAAAATRITQRMHYTIASLELVPAGLNLLLVAALALGGGGLLAAAGVRAVSFGAGLALALFFTVRLFPGLAATRPAADRESRSLLSYSLPVALAGVFGACTLWMDRIFVGTLRSASEVGVYQAASQTAFVFLIIASAFNLISAPMIADLYHRREWERLQSLFRTATKWELYLCLPPALLVLFRAPAVMTAVYGGEFTGGAAPLAILTGGLLALAAAGTTAPLLTMTGHQKTWIALSGGAFALNCALNALLIPVWGLAGAAAATSAALATLYLVGLWRVRALAGLWPYDKRYGKGLMAAVAAACALAALEPLAADTPALSLPLDLFFTTAAFAGALWLQGFDDEDRRVSRQIRQRLAGSFR